MRLLLAYAPCVPIRSWLFVAMFVSVPIIGLDIPLFREHLKIAEAYTSSVLAALCTWQLLRRISEFRLLDFEWLLVLLSFYCLVKGILFQKLTTDSIAGILFPVLLYNTTRSFFSEQTLKETRVLLLTGTVLNLVIVLTVFFVGGT